MAGIVGGSINLDAQYLCRYCDSRMDLVPHALKLLNTCTSVASRADIENILNVGICILRGSQKRSGKKLLHRIESMKAQAPKAWYKRLSKFLLENGFKRGKIDNTLFLKSRGKELLVEQVYVDDIIFGTTTNPLCKEFTALMSSEFEMIMMGELTFFLELQIKQSPQGTSIYQEKYIKELLKKFSMKEAKIIHTPMRTNAKLDKDEVGTDVNQTMYRVIIGSFLYLTASRPDMIFSVGMCDRFQATPKESHLKVAKISVHISFGVGQTDESITSHNEVLVSPVINPGEILPCSPTLVLLDKYSQNFEAQSVVKPTLKTPTKDLEVVSQPGDVLSTMSERLFEGDLPEGKGMESNILATAEELVVVQSLASLRRDTQPTLLEQECRSPERVHHSVQPVFDQTLETIGFTSEEEDEEETPLVWSRKGVRGENASTTVIPNLGETEVVPETRIENEHTESEKKRKRKGKRKMVESPTKADRKRYTTRGVVQKLLGDALVANEVQIERN
ncbi:uncharacterized protein [Solanum tuberosum]|uniref:uncharacterized protein n=1 Tax=Solanum tuberosum TaxID=4113 RepID=UPI00073A4758|nr:PREDICTED: uncharacterized protein LOC107062441 [Solanum tuberosum]